jgi:hypothetical protein
MARLVVRTQNGGDQVLELKLGLNRLGRSPENDFQIEHPTISATHCEVVVSDGQLIVHDCDSTNGTRVGGETITQAALAAGQSFYIGDVEILVETTEVTVAIPKFDVPPPAPPVVREDGSLLCPRHAQSKVTHQCEHCREVMCDKCVHHMRRRGGKTLKLCPLCSHKVELIGGEKKKKKSLLGMLHKTVKLPFLHISDKSE